MNKRRYSTWEEIKSKYPDMWVSIIEPETMEGKGLKRGIVIGANKDMKTLAKETKIKINQGLDFLVNTLIFTGEIKHHVVGMYALERTNAQT